METIPTTIQTFEKCNVCKGVSNEEQINCNCTKPLWWNGNTCVTEQECPCIVGHIS